MDQQILDFLIEAKRRTYASQGDDASVLPLLTGSRQLEYRNGSFFYRDIYFGVAYFAGQETVYKDEIPYWSMSYAGGVDRTITAKDDIRGIYAFLRSALRQVSKEHIFRGPATFTDGIYEYKNTSEGHFESFHGTEIITQNNRVLYSLHYSGGILR